MLLHVGDDLRRDPRLGDDLVVHHPHTTLTDRSHREFGLEGHAELAHQDHVERRSEPDGHLCGHRHAAPRQAEDDRVLLAEMGQQGRESAARLSSVGEH